jgi:hypothetical protein
MARPLPAIFLGWKFGERGDSPRRLMPGSSSVRCMEAVLKVFPGRLGGGDASKGDPSMSIHFRLSSRPDLDLLLAFARPVSWVARSEL